ncbi:MAG: 30S ribosomal protein S4 [Candidatus Amesbacteria bacterium GW2011_GWB1_47_26]|uniref:Small ribosomal subunit protein uS4 n=1 Tax=Candidatus Amesbacteria bacterium GW2011_GWC2_45_19 TaxID=1618366 RepID=A0A0G1M4A6_9BACT|nr:MAG: 30S ribosomal protein S4 [Candidatus Amesbacteria bacterium GW2011_GWC2_45_19]KKU38507.1 MAG: 30S ribosomal protein S4 [Candidatus Amesbacteria bacterium GW2011_GWA1_46_35]KKU69204.1 MAG: 30S ribosomal protein S4 [Microgenomates group bacterium GW2011_GWC1_47_20]KKU74675.1 MAG: 30S ribosomal protein S4 [Candidatus Amesbacteria bacterium GW2011_GWB1_47_26]KKU80137.1 MAG: 30S ribosomal protein S4 [Candidatus Amesbacteria bacterium GW2011_GWA2_47_70]
MARYTGPKNRLSRREGMDLFGKGNKLRRAAVPPGQHGPKGVRRLSDYGAQLREKQKCKRLYGLLEKQFHRYYKVAGATFLALLETRLDNTVYRLGFTPTRAMARQLVGHYHILVNSQPVNIPSYQVRPGDIITVGPKIQLPVSDIPPSVPVWLSRQALVGKVERLPGRADIDTSINDQLIVEYYSR